ncbi:non-ribosomal peptide synthetase [Gordonia insulae]|uniref:Surfactin synthase subunit 2 n=1 Tax=Gordonia insulae TaxID=2420509 RepID=A0A3G8JT96_9ACTN|nr:non-ribosomal peptide synthetase [Gordonia insulae]AZG48096.1 Surfactin synthase subunit 2 [Gordonia insulae]
MNEYVPTHTSYLSAAQHALWTTQQAIPDVPINAAQYVEIDGPINVDEFVHHTSEAVRRSKFMQVRFEDSDDGLVGVYDPSLHYWADVIDLRGEDDPRSTAEAMMREDYSRPLDPRVDRTTRGCLFILGDEKFLVYNRAHHLVTDGIGAKERMVEALAAYTAGVKGTPLPAEKPVDFDLPARADAKYRSSSRFETDRAYWREAMAGVGMGRTLAHRHGAPAAIGWSGAAPIPDATMKLLHRVAEQHSTILPTLITAAFGAYLSRAADGDEVIFQFPVAARTTAELRSTPLPVANTVPLRTHVAADGTVESALQTTQSALMGALRHQRYRGEDIWADVAADETSGRTPRTAAQERSGPMLNLMLFDREFPCGDATATFHILTVGLADDLTINIYPLPGKSGSDSLMVGFEANPNRYAQAEVDEHHRQFLGMLETFSRALLEAPGMLVGDLGFVGVGGLDTSSPSGSDYSSSGGGFEVRDARGHRVPAWMTGEIWVDGERTGDLGHIDGTSGELVVDHRLADQVVVDGVRVDLGELEQAALEVVGVQAVVAVAGATGLGIGILADDNADRDRLPAAVRRRVNSVVPQVIWPDKVALIDSVPTTASGVADRDAVALLLAATRSAPKPYSAPRTPTEEAVAEAVAAIVGVERPSMDDDLVQLGANSMAFMQLAAHLGASLKVVVGVRELNDVATLRDLATVIEKAAPRRESAGGAVQYRPTRAQQEIWLLNRADQHAIVYHLPVHLSLVAGVTADIVRKALIDVAGRHEALRTIYPDDDGEPLASVRSVADAIAAAPITRATLDAAGIERAVSTPFDLTVAAPWRAVIDESGDTVDLVLVAHHIAIDEWSLPIVLEDFSHAVQARMAGDEPLWQSEAIGFSATLEARDPSEDSAGKFYWLRTLRRAPTQIVLPAPATAHTAGLTRGPATYLRRTIDGDIRDAAVERARTADTTLNSLLCVALSTTLSDYTDTDDLVLSMPVAGRETSDELHQVGMYVQTVPLRTNGIRKLIVTEALTRVGASVSKALQHAASAPTGLSDVIFAYHADQPDVTASGIIADGDSLPTFQARTALEFSIVDGPDGLEVTLTVASQHVDVGAAEHILDRFLATVAGLAQADGAGPVVACAPVTAWPARTSRTTLLIDPVDALLRHTASRPHATALVAGDDRLTYRQLTARARDLAARLTQLGVRHGDRVALMTPGGSDTVVAMIATLMIDAVYVPVDPDHPQARIDLLLNATEPAALVTAGLRVTSGAGLAVADPIPGGAYVIHTSGSTGVPKGVVVTRANVAAMLGAALDVVGADERDVWSWVHSYTFDFSVWEILGALASGGSVVAVDRVTVRDPRLLAATLDLHAVTILSQTPTAFGVLTDPAVVGPGALAMVRAVVFGGEALSPAALRGFVDRRVGVGGGGFDTSSPSGSDYSTTGERSPSGSDYSTTGQGGSECSTGGQGGSDYSTSGGRAEYSTGGEGGSGRGLRLINMYGITETTVHLTACDVDVDDERSIVGAPLDGVAWAVLDSRLTPVPTGAVGDLYIAGEQLSLGYLNAPALTAARFVADPAGSGARMYRTGDRVREVEPGRLVYLGRVDDQVQLRGHRIELGEIATVLRSVPGVGDVRVMVAPGQTAGDERLVAFVTEDGFANRDALLALTEAALLDACVARLPAYAVPARVCIVEGYPMTPTGKLDREKLLAGLLDSPTSSRELAGLETAVAAAMHAVIGDGADPSPDTNFFAAGGTSLSAARFAAALAAAGHPVGVGDIFDHPTVEGLARMIENASSSDASAEHLPSLGVQRDEPQHLPLTPEQMDIWLRWRTQPDFTGYLMPLAIPVPASPDTVRRAVATIVGRHDALRTSFPLHDASPYQRRWSDDELAEYLAGELSTRVPATSAETALSSLVTPIDVGAALPWRVRVTEFYGETWILVVVHHIAVDGESLPILRDELAREISGSTGAANTVDYRQYTMWRDETVRAREAELVAHWSSAFTEPVRPLMLPEINLRAAANDEAEVAVHRASGSLADSLTGALDALAVQRRTTAFIVVHTALAAVLARQGDSPVVTIGTAVSGRLDPRLATVPGLFARAVPLHTAIDLDLPFGELLARVTDVDLGAFAHSDLPLTAIADIADPGRAGAGTPLFEVSFGMVPDEVVSGWSGGGGLDTPSRRLLDQRGDRLGGGDGLDTPSRLAARRLLDQRKGGVGLDQREGGVGLDQREGGEGDAFGVPLFGIDVSMYRADGHLHLTMTCTDRVASAERLDALCRLVIDTLGRAVTDVDRPTTALLTGADAVPQSARPAETLADLLSTGLADHPDAIAVHDGTALTNVELDRLATTLARDLIARGIGPGDIVVQQLPRSVWGVIATVAVARTGAAFVNVDPADPAERRRSVVARCRPRAVLTLTDHARELDPSTAVIAVDQITPPAETAPFDVTERVRPLRVDDAAYLTFTSGTTGTPKGVVVTHRGLAGWARDTVTRLHLTEDDRVLHTYAVGFDAHLMGIVPARIVGAPIVICPPDVIAADDLRDVITHHDVTVLLSTPSVLATLHPHELRGVRHVAVGGEPLGAALVRDWTSVATMSNEYGPTESTVAVSSARFTDPVDGSVPIGAPIAGVTAHVLDSRLRAVPAHTVGELYVAGSCLARGYLDDPALTAAAFIADPAGSGERMYRTGDLVHRRADGTLVIHGRTDDQVKIRGIRLEPSEIDVALTRLPEVANAVTAVRTTAGGEKILVSWVAAEPGTDIRPDTLRTELSHVLPRSIIPSDIISVASLPIGRNGKVDLAALPEPETVPTTAVTALSHATHHLVAGIWAEVLDVPVDHLDADADFFAVGGTSLSATRVSSRLAAATGVDVPVRVLFESRSLRAVADYLDEQRGADTGSAPESLPVPEHLPLAHPQRRMWIHHRYDPESTAYHVPVVIRIAGDIDIAALQKAVDAVVDTHAVLRTVYPDTEAGPVQRILDRAGPVLRHETVETGDERVAIDDFLSAPFDLEHEPGFRAVVLEVGERGETRERYFVAALHHIAIDGWSMRILLHDLLRAYRGEILPGPADGALSYADFTQWQTHRLGGPDDPASRYTAELGHWMSTLDGVVEPFRIPGRRATELEPGRLSARMDRAIGDRLRQAASGMSATVFHLAHAALVATLGQWTGRWDGVVGVPVHGRTAADWESVVGMFVNTVALRTRVAVDEPIGAVVAQARDVALTAADHAEVPYDAVARAVRPNAHDGFDPLISVLLVNEDVLPTISDDMLTGGPDDANGWRAAVVDAISTVDAKFDIEVVLAEDDGAIVVTVVHSGYIPRDVAGELLDDFTTLLVAAAGDVAAPFPLLDGRVVEAPVDLGTERVVAVPQDRALVGSVVGVMAEVLGVPESAVVEGDDFFTLGGTSLSATRVTSTLGRELGVRVPTRLLFENPGPVELARAVSELRTTDTDVRTAVEGVRAVGGGGEDLPLAPTQRRMWVNSQLLGDVSIYAVPVVVPVPSGVDAAHVIDAVHTVVGRHAALRTRFLTTSDGPRQRIVSEWRPEIRRMAADSTGAALGEFGEPFDLAAGPPVRVWLMESGTAPVAVVMLAHHIVLDGESAVIVGDELTALLSGTAPAEAAVGFDVVARRMAADEERSRADHSAFWADTLDGYSGRLDLTPRRPVTRDLRTATVEFALDAQTSGLVGLAARGARASDFHVLHAGVALALAIQAGTDDVAVATPVSLRRDADSARTVGMLISTVVLRTRFAPGLTAAGLIEYVRDTDLAASDHAAIAFDDVVAIVDPPREPGRHPLVQVAFSVADGSAVGWSGADGGLLDARSEFDVHVVAMESADGWRLRLEYARDLFDEALIRALGERMVAGVAAVVGDRGRALSSVDLLSAGEREFVAGWAGWSRYAASPSGSSATRPAVGEAVVPFADRVASERSEAAYRDHDQTPTPFADRVASERSEAAYRDHGHAPLLGDLLAAAVEQYPTKPAIADGTRTLTYRELDDWVSETARALRAREIGVGDVVAVVIPRSIESVVALWAVTRIGGVCVPVDVTYPAARLDQVVTATGATLIVPDDVPPQPTEHVVPEPVIRVSPDELAYVITTSGTTGTPNIVGVPHRGVHRVASLGDVTDSDRVGMAISPGFDATFHDLLLPLATGATLVVVPADVSGGHDLTDFLREQRVTVFTATPSVMRTLTAPDITSLRLVYIGGEALTADLADTWARHAQVVNIYGPTETTVTVSTGPYRAGGPVRIGRPRPGIGALVLDRQLRPVPPGVAGELYVTGTGVARGYLGDPALTAASFVATADGRRGYRTGDVVRWDRATGELVYLGRADRQVKVRGQRVEPAEIDAVLMNAGAAQSVTVLRDGPAGPALVAYVVSPDTPTRQLRDRCRAMLPRHMVPSRIVEIATLPLTGAGKLDANRLPEPEWVRSRRAPTTPIDHAVVDAFGAVLGVDVGMDDDFFAVGGNSLALLSLRDELVRRTGVAVSVPEMFAHSTPQEIAELIERPEGETDDRVVRLSGSGDDARNPVWCVHTAAGVVEQFRPLADALTSTPVMGLQLPELIDATRDMPTSLTEMATRHVTAMRAVQQTGPYRLIGWSVGGVIAHEIARQLVEAGEEVALLVLLDPRTPSELDSVPDDELRETNPLRDAAERRDPVAVRRFDERSATMARAARSYDLRPFPVAKVLYVAATDNPDPGAWGRVVGGDVEVMAVDSTHATLGDPGVMGHIAQRLEEEL